METKNNIIVIGLLTSIIGLGVGYFMGANKALVITHQMSDGTMMSSVDMETVMHGMMSLEGKSGAELEKAFLDEMIVHHEGAIEMAQTFLEDTNRPELIELGNNIITTQNGEIEMMKKWRIDWFGR